MFDVYLHINYISEKKWTYNKCIVYLANRGHKFSSQVSIDDRAVDTGQYNIHIKKDKKTISILQKIAKEYFSDIFY